MKRQAELLIQTGHKGHVFALAFSPDSRLIASGGMDNTVRLWDLHSQMLVAVLRGHASVPESLAFSPDGMRLASHALDRKLCLWDPQAGQLLWSVVAHRSWLHGLSFSPGGELIATGCADGTARLWNPKTGGCIRTLRTDAGIGDLAFHPQGRTLAIGGSAPAVVLWDVAGGTESANLEPHNTHVRALAFSPGGDLLAAACGDKTVRLWDVPSGRVIWTVQPHSWACSDVAFSPHGDMLLTVGDQDHAAKMLRVEDGSLALTLVGTSLRPENWRWVNEHWFWAITYSPDGKLAAAAGSAGTVNVWDTRSGQLQAALGSQLATTASLAISPDGRLLALGQEARTRLWDVTRGKQLAVIEDLADPVAFSPDGRQLAGRSREKGVAIHSVATRARLSKISGEEGSAVTLAFSPDGSLLAWGYNTINIGDAATASWMGALQGHDGGIDSVAFSPDSRYLASAGWDWTLRVWDPRALQPRWVAQAISRTRSQLAKRLKDCGGWAHMLHSAVYSPDGTHIAVGQSPVSQRPRIGGRVLIYNANTGKRVAAFGRRDGGSGPLAYSPDGRYIAAGGHSGCIDLWNANTGELATVLGSHQNRLTAVAFAPDGSWLASSSENGSIKLWDMRQFREILTLLPIREAGWVLLAPGGRLDASADAEALVTWRVGNEVLPFAAHQAPRVVGLWPQLWKVRDR